MFFVNIVSLIAAAATGMLFGFFWYSDFLFAKKWAELSKISKKQIASTNAPISITLGSTITLLTSLGLAGIYHYFEDAETTIYAVLCILTLVALNYASSLVWEKISITLYAINLGYTVLSWLLILLTYIAVYHFVM